MINNDGDGLVRGKQVGESMVLVRHKTPIEKILRVEMVIEEEPATFVSKVLLNDRIVYPCLGLLGGQCAEVITIGLV